MRVSLVCVLESFRASVSAFRVSELLVVRLSFVVKLFACRLCVCEILKFSCRISNSNFSFRCSIRFLESRFLCRIWICRRIRFLEFRFEFVVEIFRFECRVQVPWISNSSFSFHCSIRFLESDFEFVVEFDFSNFVSNFKFECVVEISRRNCRFRRSIRFLESHFEFVVKFDFSKSIVKFDFSNVDFSSQVPWIWWFEIVVEFRIRLDLFDFSNFDDRQVLELLFSKSHSSFEFLIELFNFRRNLMIINAIVNWRPQLFSHDRSRFALVATRALRALFVRKILVKRQFTFSLYFGIIEL